MKPWSDFSDEIMTIIDMKFINSYTDPTLLVLYSKNLLWDGSVSTNTETCSLISITLNFSTEKFPVVWKVDRLPYNSQYIVPLIKPLSGCAVVAKNSFHFISQSSAFVHLSLNSSSHMELYSNFMAY